MADDKPYVTIATPSYKQGRYIEQTLSSLLDGQGDLPYEVIVMDGGSTDETVDILKAREKDPRLHWTSEPDKGQSDAINKALAKARGEVFNWICSDDLLVPGAMETIIHRFRLDPKLRILCGVCAKFDDETNEVTGLLQMETKRDLESTIMIGRCVQPSSFWRTEFFRGLGGLVVEHHLVMDWHLWLRYLLKYGMEGVGFCDETLAQFREHPAAKSSSGVQGYYNETNAIWLDLFTYLNAPEELLAFLAAETPVRVPKWDWDIGPHIKPNRLFFTACTRWAHKYRKTGREEKARFLNDMAWKCEKRPSTMYMNSYWKLRNTKPWQPEAETQATTE